MDIQATSLVMGIQAHAPEPAVPDLRPAASAAASTQNTDPDIPLPIPPTTQLQAAAVSRSIGTTPEAAQAARPDAPVRATERTLKPYGVAMLPNHQDETAEKGS